jgi:hypothetical protein
MTQFMSLTQRGKDDEQERATESLQYVFIFCSTVCCACDELDALIDDELGFTFKDELDALIDDELGFTFKDELDGWL